MTDKEYPIKIIEINKKDILYTKSNIMDILSNQLSDMINISKKQIFKSLSNRENIGNTGLYYGIALPHIEVSSYVGAPFIGVSVLDNNARDWFGIDNDPITILLSIVISNKTEIMQKYRKETIMMQLLFKKIADDVFLKKIATRKSEKEIVEFIEEYWRNTSC